MMPRVLVAKLAILVGIQACKDRPPAGTAGRSHGEGVRESNSPLCKLVECRRLDDGVAVAPDLINAMVIGYDQQDIPLTGGSCRQPRRWRTGRLPDIRQPPAGHQCRAPSNKSSLEESPSVHFVLPLLNRVLNLKSVLHQPRS